MKFCYHLLKILSNWIFEFNVEYVFNETKLDVLMFFFLTYYVEQPTKTMKPPWNVTLLE
jgi:hypothetical protein